MSPIRTWILIADAAHARAYLSLKPRDSLERVDDFAFDESIPPAREIAGHQPGSSQPSVGSAHHTVGSGDPRRDMKRQFAVRVARALDAAHKRAAFDKLVIVCPPTMLGDLRTELSRHVAAAVIAELPKDLVKTPDHDLLAHFKDVPAITRSAS
jgi:protein required for attachment to host cells